MSHSACAEGLVNTYISSNILLNQGLHLTYVQLSQQEATDQEHYCKVKHKHWKIELIYQFFDN